MLYSSDTLGSTNDADIKKQHLEIATALDQLVKGIEPAVKLAVVVIHDCSVEMIVARAGKLKSIGELVTSNNKSRPGIDQNFMS